VSKQSTPWATRRIYEFIKAHRRTYDVHTMCRVPGVARSGYYAWLEKPKSNRAEEDARLLRLIPASFKASQGIYGSPRVFLDLREAGETCSKHRVARLMRQTTSDPFMGTELGTTPLAKPLSSYLTWSSEISMSSARTKSGSLILRIFGLGRIGSIWRSLWICSPG